MRFESLLKGLLVFTVLFCNSLSVAVDDVAVSVEDEIPDDVDGAAVDKACSRIPENIDYVEWEKQNVTITQIERTRICAEQTDAIKWVVERNIKRCDLYTKACYRSAQRSESEAEAVESCNQATRAAEEKIAGVQKDFKYLKVVNRSCHQTLVRMCNDNSKSTFCTEGFRSFAEAEPGSFKTKIVDRIDKTTRRVEKLGQRIETAGEIAGYVREGKAIIEGQAATTTNGDTNIQQSYGPETNSYAGAKEYYDSRNAASDNQVGRVSPVSTPSPSASTTPSSTVASSSDSSTTTSPASSTSGSSTSSSSGVLSGLKKVGQGVQSVVTNSGVLATTGLLRNQYLQKKDAKKSQVERQAALDQATALNSHTELQNNLLKIKEDNSASSGSSRPETNGRTGVGSGGTPIASNAAGSQSQQNNQGNPVAFSSASTSTGTSRASNSPSRSGSGGSSSASSTSSSGGGSQGRGATAASTGSDSSGADQNLQKYTKDRGFFGALARAFGFKNKKTEAAATAASKLATTNAVELSPKGNITQTLNKRWNRTLGRVETGSSRGLASVGSKDHGMTAKNRSIFGSICNRYSSFRKESQLGAGRAVCPGN